MDRANTKGEGHSRLLLRARIFLELTHLNSLEKLQAQVHLDGCNCQPECVITYIKCQNGFAHVIWWVDVQTAQDSNGENSRRGGSNTTCFFHFEYLNRTHITEGSRSLSFFYEGRRKANVSPQFCCFIQQSLNGNQWLLQPLYKAYSLV